jgi:cytochrome c oxidase subunit I+III
MVVLMFVAGSLYLSFVFSYLYLWTVSPQVWAPLGAPAPPGLGWPLASAALLIGGSALLVIAGRALPQPGRRRGWVATLLLLALAGLLASFAIELVAHLGSGLSPTASSYGAMVYLGVALFGQLVAALVVMTLFAVARCLAGLIDRERRVTFDNVALLYHYTVAQTLLGLTLVHGFPRMLA